MNDLLQSLKIGLANELEKQGSSLSELEQQLEMIEKTGAFDSISAGIGAGGSVLKGLAGMLGTIPELAVTGSLMAGTLGGSLVYGAHRHLKDQDNEMKSKQNEIDRVHELTQRLKQEHGLQ